MIRAVAREASPAQRTDPAWLEQAREASLRLLYRLLFLLSAEDRDLLPVRREGYAAYSLRGPREEAAEIVDRKRTLSARARTWWPRLTALFAAIAQGDASMGLPPYSGFAPLLLANLNASVLDFVARQKIQVATLNLYIVEQLPFVPPSAFARRFGTKSAEQIVREDVLWLTYTARDMEAFARDQGYAGPPFAWDEGGPPAPPRPAGCAVLPALRPRPGRRRECARHLPIVRREEEARFKGRFRSRDLILGYMAALAAGNPDAAVAG